MKAITFRAIALYLILAVAVAAVWGFTATPSFADEPPPAQEPSDEDEQDGEYSEASNSASVALAGPNNCWGYTDNIHVSATNTWGIPGGKVHARTECKDGPAPVIHASTQLYIWQCNSVGLDCNWTLYGTDNQSATEYNKPKANGNSAGIPCYNARYRAISYHYIFDNDGEFQAAITWRTQYLTGC